MFLTVVRHGETVENRQRIVQGQTAGHLTPEGIGQAQALAKQLADDNFDRAYSSDLQRCVDTATEILHYHPLLPVEYTPLLREMDQPGYEGQPWGAVPWDSFPGTKLTRKVPGGESAQEVWGRVHSFINAVLAKHPDDRVLVVTHGGPIRGFQVLLGDLSADEMLSSPPPLPNCALFRWEVTKPVVFEPDVRQ